MNLRTYLRLFQPIPALLMTAVFANGAAAFGLILFGLKQPDSYLLSLLVALPLLLGMDLASAAHTAMHRPFFPLLPGGLERLLRATFWAGLAGVTGITAAVAWFFPNVPPAAVFGLGAALLALPCLNHRRLVARSNLLHFSANLGSLQFPVMGLAGWALFMEHGATRLVPAMQAAPWLFFGGGLAAAAWLLRRAFSRESLRERAETPFISPNATWRLLFSRKIMTRHQEEARQHIARFGAGDALQKIAARVGRDWTVHAVGPRTRDWLRVHWHSAYGAMRHGSFFQVQGSFFLVLLGYSFLLPCMGFLFAQLDKRPFGLAGYLESLAILSSVDFTQAVTHVQTGAVLVGLLLFIGFTFALTLAGQLHPRLPYPVSRERLARMSFVHAGLQLCFALIVPTTALTVAGLFGQALSGRFAPTFGVLPLLRLDLIFVPLLLLVATASRLRSIAVRLPALIVLATVGCVLAVSRSWWDALVVTWPGILAIALSTVAATLLLRWQIRLHFCNCDLIAEAAEGRPFVATATFSFNFKRPSAPAAS